MSNVCRWASSGWHLSVFHSLSPAAPIAQAHLECWETRDFILLNKEFAETVRPDDTNDILFYFVNRTNTIVAGLQKHLIKWYVQHCRHHRHRDSGFVSTRSPSCSGLREDVLEVPGVRMSADSLIQFRTADRLRSYTSTAVRSLACRAQRAFFDPLGSHGRRDRRSELRSSSRTTGTSTPTPSGTNYSASTTSFSPTTAVHFSAAKLSRGRTPSRLVCRLPCTCP